MAALQTRSRLSMGTPWRCHFSCGSITTDWPEGNQFCAVSLCRGRQRRNWEREKKRDECAEKSSNNCPERVGNKKRECPTFLHETIDRELNLDSEFDSEGKGTHFLWDACGQVCRVSAGCFLCSLFCPSKCHHLCKLAFR